MCTVLTVLNGLIWAISSVLKSPFPILNWWYSWGISATLQKRTKALLGWEIQSEYIFSVILKRSLSTENYRTLYFLQSQLCYLGGKYLFFVSSRSVKMRGFSFLSLYKSVFIFQFLNVKMYNYGKQNTIVNFIIKKLKKTQFPQKV